MPNSPFILQQETNGFPSSASQNIVQRLRTRRSELGLLIFCLFLFFWRLGDAPLFDLDEALYVTCAQQMVVSGDWVTPRLNTRQPERPGVAAIPFFEKPILVYWASAGAMRVFGRNLWAARLPAALAALLTTFAITLFGQHRFTRRAGVLAGFVFAANPMTLIDARQMTTDGLLVLWFTGAMFCFWHIQEEGNRREEKKRRREQEKPEDGSILPLTPYPLSLIPFLFWLLCALAILTKGIVGLLLPLMIIGVYLLLGRVLLRVQLRTPVGPRLRFALGLHPLRTAWAGFMRLRPLIGLLLLLAVAAPWHLRIVGSPERDAQGRTWVMEYIQRQHIGRFKGLDTVHNQPLPTFFVYFLLFFFPWAGFAPAAFRAKDEGGRMKDEEGIREKGEGESAEAPSTIGNRQSAINSSFLLPPSSFLLTWFWTLFVFFSLGAAKLPTYIAPAYPAAALLVGRWLDGILTAKTVDKDEGKAQRKGLRSLRRGALGALCIGLLLLVALPFAPRFVPPTAPLPVGVLPLAWHLALTLALGSACAWLCFRLANNEPQAKIENRKSKIGSGIGMLIAMMGVVVAILGGEGYTVLRGSVLGPYQQVAAAAGSDAQQGIPIVYYNIVPRRPSMNFYAGYSPFEHKEVPLLPFLVQCLPPQGRQADVVLTYSAYARLLKPEIASVPGASLQLLQQRGPNGEWVLARVSLPSNYKPTLEEEQIHKPSPNP